jgi:hypothetical protein
MRRLFAICLALPAAAACGSDNNGNGGNGGTADAGGGNGNENRLPITSVGTVQDPSASGDAKWDCLGMKTTPTSSVTTPVSFKLEVKDFEDDFAVGGVKVQVFADNLIDASSCEAPGCVESMTDGSGFADAVGIPGTWFAYRVFPKQGATAQLTVTGSVQFNETAPRAGGNADGVSVSLKTLDLIPSVLGFRRTPGAAIIAGRLNDCDGRDVYGARVKIFRPDGSEILEGAKQPDPHYRYFDGEEFPSATTKFTQVDGLFAIANIPIPANNERIKIELYGRRAGDSEPVLLARDRVNVFPDTATIINLQPLRSDSVN